MTPRALSIDLFGTIVFFDAKRLPRRRLADREWIVTIPDLESLLARAVPAATEIGFLHAVSSASDDILREKRETLREVPTFERYRRALLALGAPVDVALCVASEMAERHMASLASTVTCPEDRPGLLATLADHYPLALVSNFDHGPTARAILERFHLTAAFRSIVVSAEVGYVKPAGPIFTRACDALGVAPQDCVHVGDSMEADVKGALAAGMNAVWIGEGTVDDRTDRIADLRELPARLATR